MSSRFHSLPLVVACAVVLLGLLSVPAAGGASLGDGGSPADADRSLVGDATLAAEQLQVDGGLGENDSVGDNDTLGDNGTSLLDDSSDGTATDDTATDDGSETTTDSTSSGSLSADVGGISVDANLSGSTDGTTNETNLSVDASLDAAGTGVDADASLNDGGMSVDADATVAGALNASAGVTADGVSTGTASRASRADGGAVSTVEPHTEAAGGGDAPVDRDGTSGGGLPAAPTAALGAVAIVGGATAAHRGLSVVSHGPTPGGLSHTLSAGVDWLRWHAPRVLVPFGYSRYDDSDPLEHEARAALYDHVERAPGVHLTALAADADVSLSSVRHHLRILEEESLVERHSIRGKRRYFPVDEANPELVAALDDPATASVLRAVAAAEPASGSELADRLGRDPSTISHHLSGLEADGLVERERNGQAVETRLAEATRDVLAVEAETPMPTPAD